MAPATTKRVFDVLYNSVDVELFPKGLGLGLEWPKESVRLVYDDGTYLPLMLMAATGVLYRFILVPFVFPMWKPNTPEEKAALTKGRDAHNRLMCLYSAACFCATTWYLYSDGQLFDWQRQLCTPVEGTYVRAVNVTFTLSKIWEWKDTFYLVTLGRSRPQFLHLYHHATTFWLFCIVCNLPGTEKQGMMLNAFVHTLMYGHYWRPFPKAVVPIVTIAQIIQLATVTYTWGDSLSRCGDTYGAALDLHLWETLTPYAMVPVYLWLFIVFFAKRWIFGIAKPKAKSS